MTSREKMREIRRDADDIAHLIVCTDYPRIDIEIKKAALQEKTETYFPGTARLYDMIYESRFNRLFEQWRSSGGVPYRA